MSRRSSVRYVKPILLYGFLTLVLIWFLFPFYWTTLTSFKYFVEMFESPPTFVPRNWTLENYQYAFSTFPPYFLNSAVVGAFSTIFALTIGSLAGYSFARHRSISSYFLFFVVLLSKTFPPIVSVIPLFILIRALHLLDTLAALILVHTALNLPFVIWMVTGFIRGVPKEIEDSAMIDGCSRIGALFRIVLPAMKSGLAVTAIFAFLGSWDEFLYALSLTSLEAKTLPVIMAQHITVWEIKWGGMTAGGVLYVLPVLAFSFVLQKYMVKGLTMGAVKG